MANCLPGRFRHSFFHLFRVGRHALYYRYRTASTLIKSLRTISWEHSSNVRSASLHFVWSHHPRNWWHTSPWERMIVSFSFTVASVILSRRLSMTMLSHPIALHHGALYRTDAPYMGSDLHHIATGFQLCLRALYCTCSPGIAPTCTRSCKRCLLLLLLVIIILSLLRFQSLQKKFTAHVLKQSTRLHHRLV